MRARLHAMCIGRAAQTPEAARERLSKLWMNTDRHAFRDREEAAIDVLCLDPMEPSSEWTALRALLDARRRAKDDATASALAAEIVDPDDTIDDERMDARLSYFTLSQFIGSPRAIPACRERAMARLVADYERLGCESHRSNAFERPLTLHIEPPPERCRALSGTLCFVAHEHPGQRYCSTYAWLR